VTPEEKARELATEVASQINQERKHLAETMKEAGMTSERYIIQDNLLEVIKNPHTPYQCWAELKVVGINA
jgi:hypothetical protein